MHMDPGALITDIGHFKEVLVQAGFSDGLLEQRLMGSRGARGHYHPIQIMFLYHFLYLLLGVLGASIEIIPGVNHVREALGILNNLGHSHISTDIDPTLANEHSYSGFLSGNILFRYVFLLLDQSITRRSKQGGSSSGRAACLHHCFRDILWPGEGTANVNSSSGSLHWGEFTCVAESVLVELDIKSLCQSNTFWGRLKPYR